MAAFDVITEDRADLIRLLKEWTAAAEEMTQGRETGETAAEMLRYGDDVGADFLVLKAEQLAGLT